MRHLESQPARYAVAIVFSFAAMGLAKIFSPFPYNTAIFVAAVTAAAWVAGWRASLVASLVSAVLFPFSLPPINDYYLQNPGDVVRVLLFLAVALMITFVMS